MPDRYYGSGGIGKTPVVTNMLDPKIIDDILFYRRVQSWEDYKQFMKVLTDTMPKVPYKRKKKGKKNGKH